jgi:Protein of unknown function
MFDKEVPVPLDRLTAEQEARIAQLTDADLGDIDNCILSNATTQWRKVAMVVALTMNALSDLFSDLPDSFYAMRIKELFAQGRLESQGDVEFMRFSEVRLPEISSSSPAT